MGGSSDLPWACFSKFKTRRFGFCFHGIVQVYNARPISLFRIISYETICGTCWKLHTKHGEVEPLANRSASSFTREQYTTLERFLTAFYNRYPGGNVFGHNDLDVDEIDPYFDVQDYIEKVFRKTTNKITDPLSESPVDPTDTSVNK